MLRRRLAMIFSPGDQVHVSALGKGVVREIRNGGRYLVEVKGRSVLLDGSQLTAVEQRKRSKRHEKESPRESPLAETMARTHAAGSLDLHGMTAPDAIAALDAFLSDAILAGLTSVRIIHGKTGGRLKAAVHRRLTMLASVRQFQLDPANSGVTVVDL